MKKKYNGSDWDSYDPEVVETAYAVALEAIKNIDVEEAVARAISEEEEKLSAMDGYAPSGAYDTSDLAFYFQLSAQELHELLQEFNLSWKSGEDKANHLSITLRDRGYAEEYLYTKPAGKTPAVNQLRSKWTWKGKVFLALLLQKVGIQPFGRVCPKWLELAENHDDVPF